MKSKTYEEFVNKFKPKLTTDDCYTPPPVYDAVKEWVCREYDVFAGRIVRPFWPGADYTKTEYPEGCVVLDNPPFSILAKICEWYLDRGIKFFLFAPSLTALSGKNICMRMNHLICDADITYANGANVRTAFVTNLGDGDTVLQTAPTLGKAVNDAVKKMREETTRSVPKYEYPAHVVTASMLQKYSKYGVEFSVSRSECVRISALDAQRDAGKSVYGSGLLLSNKAAAAKAAAERAAAERAAAAKAAAERAAAERAAATVWELSDREKSIVLELGKR